jgi:hypothetical protein
MDRSRVLYPLEHDAAVSRTWSWKSEGVITFVTSILVESFLCSLCRAGMGCVMTFNLPQFCPLDPRCPSLRDHEEWELFGCGGHAGQDCDRLLMRSCNSNLSTVLTHPCPSGQSFWDDLPRCFIAIDHSVVINRGEEFDHYFSLSRDVLAIVLAIPTSQMEAA